MLKEIVELGGRQWLIPVALILAGAWLANWLFGLHQWRSQRRREFLELWPKRVADDDVWAEVALRHLVGAYLPNAVVKAVLALPDKAIALFQLAEVWSYLCVSSDAPPQLRWKRWLYRERWGRWVALIAFNLGYFAAAWLGAMFWAGATSSPTSTAWAWGVDAVALFAIALSFLVYAGRLKTASELAPRHVERLNRHWMTSTPVAAASSPVDRADPQQDLPAPPLVG